jgi:hypothetical protein
MVHSHPIAFLCVCLLAPFLSFASAWGETPATAQPYVVVMESAEIPENSTQGLALFDAFAKNGYQAVSGHDSKFSLIRTEHQLKLRTLVNQLKAAEVPSQIVFYYRGPFYKTQDEKGENTQDRLDLAALAEQLVRLTKSHPDKFSIVLLLDLETESSFQEIRSAVADAIHPIQANLSALIARRKLSDWASPSPVASILCQGLTDERSVMAEKDHGMASMSEVKKYLQEHLSQRGNEAEMDVVSTNAEGTIRLASPENPAETISANPNDTIPKNLETTIADIGNQLVRELQEHKVSSVVIPIFEEKVSTETKRRPGPLAAYIAEQVRRHVADAMKEKIAVFKVLPENQTAALFTGLLQIDLKNGEVRNATVALSGEICIPTENSKAELKISLNESKGPLCIDEVGMSGYVNMSPQAVKASGIRWEIDDIDASPSLIPHPMKDSHFPLRVTLVSSKGKPYDFHFSKDNRHMYVNLQKENTYAILVENLSDQDLFLRLLVDGRNTLPERIREGDDLKPAQCVSLTQARCWFCEKGQKYCIRGFYTKASEEKKGDSLGDFNEFVVADVNDKNVVVTKQDYRDQLGIITAAFYAATKTPTPTSEKSSMGLQPQFATRKGQEGKEKLKRYEGQLAPGELVGDAAINIHYGFQDQDEGTP